MSDTISAGDPRHRFLLWLGAITLLAVSAAAFTLSSEALRGVPRFQQKALLPDFEGEIDKAAEIAMKNADGETIVRRGDDSRWTMPAVGNYPARTESVRKLLFGLSALKAVELRTARKDWHAALDLGAPEEGGKATAIRVKDKSGKLLAGLLIGKTNPGGGLEGRDAYYARRIGEDQTYVVEGNLPLEALARDWLEPTIVDIARERIQRVTLGGPQGPSYTISRATADSENFTLDNLPSGRTMSSETAANGIGAALADLTLEGARPRKDIDFSTAAQAIYETFDGLTLTLRTVKQGENVWLALDATAAPDAAKTVSEEVQAITAKTTPWAYQIPAWKGELFTRSRESLISTPAKQPTQLPVPNP